MNKFYAVAGTLATLMGFAVNKASAASLLTVPTTTASDALASVSDTLADPGTLLIIVAVIALPVVFWLIRRIVGLFPKGR